MTARRTESEAMELFILLIIMSAKLASSQDAYQAGIKDTYGESQTTNKP